MAASQPHLLALLTGLLCSGLCSSQRQVEMPEGPWYRVKGFPVALSCHVSGYKGPTQQHFAFSVYKNESPEQELCIIHTADQDYAYAVFTGRVNSKDITIERLSDSSAVFHIASLRADDAGTYECFTPNTDGLYFGTYSARTVVNVIEDTLVATSSGPALVSISEGASLQLECQVSSQTFQHTHLSVTWRVRGTSQTYTIITLDKDLTVRPGTSFEERYRSGLIGIEKVEDKTYRLRISQAQPSDSGEIYCQADEWILDPDRSWTRIAYKNTTGSHVKVEPLSVTPDDDSFSSHIESLSGGFQEGGTLEVRCRVEAQNLQKRFFSMSWLKNKLEVAQIGPSGVLTVSSDYAGRHGKGELRAVKVSDGAFVLILQPVFTGDQGQYQCRASKQERTDTGLFTRGHTQISPEETVRITPKESSLAVVMAPQQVQVTEGETLHVTCRASGASGPMSVSWKHKRAAGSSFSDIISLNTEGVMEVGPLYQQREVRTFRPSSADFTLELGGAAVSDSGAYMCTVSERGDSARDANSQSQQTSVAVHSVDSLVKVALKSRDTNALENSVIKMMCTVVAPKVPLVVTWKFQPMNSQAQTDIVTISQSGVVTYRGDQTHYQLEAQQQESGTIFILKILRASRRQQGVYQCQVDAYQKDLQKAQKVSNKLGITVRRPESKMSVSTKPVSRLEIPVNSNAKVDCLVTSPTLNSSQFGVTWENNGLTLVAVKPGGVVTQGEDERIGVMMIGRLSFQLSIQQVRSADKGYYRCLVEEWVQDPDGIWYQLQEKNVSMELVVTEKGHDFSLNKQNASLSVTEGEGVALGCSLQTAALDSTFQYSLSWFFERQDQKSPTNKLLTYSHDGRLQFHDSELQDRLRFSRPAVRDFRLSVLPSVAADSGRFYCQADQYQLDCDGQWKLKSSDTSGISHLTVRLMDSNLKVKKVRASVNVTDLQAGFTLECEISSRSSDSSVFEVTWWRRKGEERPLTIFTASRDGTLHTAMGDRGLVFGRPSLSLYTLTIPGVEPSDDGLYQCHVQEWLEMPTNTWRKVAEDESGELSIRVDSEDKPSTGTFILQESNHLNTTEGKEFEISCSVNVDRWDPKFQYTLNWYVERQNSNSRSFLLTQTFDGHLKSQTENEQLKSRLQFWRPTVERFQLIVSSSVPDDSGKYVCEVDQFQLGCEGQWEKTGPPQSRGILVTVHSTENNLKVKKVRASVNVTDLQAGFTLECEISSRSSDSSVFEVTWWRRKGEERPLTIFTASRDGTLHTAMGDRGLVFGRPSLSLYTLTIPGVEPSDDGLYQCHVQEWLEMPTNTWRKVAEDESGELSIHVHGQGSSTYSSVGITLGVCAPIIFILVMVIIILLIRVEKTTSTSKTKSQDLWAEINPLKAIRDPSTDDECKAC